MQAPWRTQTPHSWIRLRRLIWAWERTSMCLPSIGWQVSQEVLLFFLMESPCHPPVGPGSSQVTFALRLEGTKKQLPSSRPFSGHSCLCPGLTAGCNIALAPAAPFPVPRYCCLIPEMDTEPGAQLLTPGSLSRAPALCWAALLPLCPTVSLMTDLLGSRCTWLTPASRCSTFLALLVRRFWSAPRKSSIWHRAPCPAGSWLTT